MSNTQPEIKRVIQLKPVHKPIVDEEVNYESQLQQEITKLQEAKEELELVKKQQELLLTETRNQIKLEKDNWEEEKKQWIEEAKKEGFQVGFAKGEKESKDQFHQLIQQANSIIAASKIDYQSTIEKSEEAILLLAVQVAERIMKLELERQPEVFVPIVKDAILSIKDQRGLSIYLHPDNYEFVLSQKNELERVLESKAELSIFVNESLETGSCVIEYPFGKIDASIDTQLNQIQLVLHEIVMEPKE
ncbi:flagellar assembly protein FliH [Paucisalibacillus globulus]|uniref:flagellar assembly protein FliH n=1 Tax=Paucisalibacillus globulus TaxID=351095 RepID=UPI00041950A0|nr:flagellar assembly protein FliH [Paucisalibacillus globulus]